MEKIILQNQKENLLFFTFQSLKTYLNKKGKEQKKACYFPVGWEKLDESNYEEQVNKYHKCIAVLTGEKNNITVVDFDTEESYINILKLCPEIAEYKTTKTRKGYHVYFKYDKDITQTTDILPKVDIRNDGGCVFAAPTKYMTLDKEVWEYKDMGKTKIGPIPEAFRDILMNAYELKNGSNKVTNKTVKAESKPTIQANAKSDMSDEDVKYFIDCLNSNRADSYADWTNFGAMIKHHNATDEGFELFKYFSQKSDDYDDATFEDGSALKLFNGFKNNITTYSLAYYAKLDSPKKYKEYIDDRNKNNAKSFINIIKEGQLKIAEHFATKFKDVVKYSNPKLYMLNTNNNLWEESKECNLITKLSKYIQCKLHELIDIYNIEKNVEKVIVIAKLLKQNTNSIYLNAIMVYLKALMNDNDFSKMLNNTKSLLSFKNGMLDLQTGEFRERLSTDYATFSLDYDYDIDNEYTELQDEILATVLKITNDNTELRETLLSYFAYSLTGETKEQKCLFLIGHLASNGKSTLLNIQANVIPEYSQKLDKRTFSENYSKSHKQLIKTIYKRMVYVEELDKKNLDVDLIKDFVDGKNLPVEVLYGTTMDLKIHAKLSFVSNFDPIFHTDEGIKRRGLLQVLTNKFLEKEDMPKEPTSGMYVKDKSLVDKFLNSNYRNAYIKMMLKYTKMYYSNGLYKQASLQKNFKDLCTENDAMFDFIDTNFTKTENDTDRIAKSAFTTLYNDANKTKLGFNALLSDLKRLGVVYKRELRHNGERGVVVGLKLNEPVDDEDLF